MPPTYDWPEAPPLDHSGSLPDGDVRTAPGKVGLDKTDPAEIRRAIEPQVGKDIANMVGEVVDAKMRALGLDKPDRQHLVFPEAEHDRNLGSNIYRKAPAERNPMQTSMDSWFRWILFGRDPGQEARQDYFSWMGRTLSSTDTEGGFLIPPGYIAEVVRDSEKISELFQWVRRIPVGVNAGEIPKVSTNATVSWGTENVAMTEGDPVFGSTNWAVNRMNVIVKLSREIANDTNPGIIDTITQLFREKIVEERDRVVAVGSGTGQPLGISGLAATTGIVELTGSITSINYSNAVTMHETVDHRYFNSPAMRWVMNQTNKARFMDVLDDHGRPIFQVDRWRVSKDVCSVTQWQSRTALRTPSCSLAISGITTGSTGKRLASNVRRNPVPLSKLIRFGSNSGSERTASRSRARRTRWS